NIVSGAAVSTTHGVSVAGTITENALFAPPRSYTITWDAGTPAGDFLVQPHSEITVAPGSYLTLRLQPNSTLHLQAARYYFSSFTAQPNSTVDIDDSAGTVMIFVSDLLLLRGTVAVHRGPESVGVIYTGTADATVDGTFLGTVLAPSAT